MGRRSRNAGLHNGISDAFPVGVPAHSISFDDLPSDWLLREIHTQTLEDV